jgi:hypothetical protein
MSHARRYRFGTYDPLDESVSVILLDRTYRETAANREMFARTITAYNKIVEGQGSRTLCLGVFEVDPLAPDCLCGVSGRDADVVTKRRG